MGTRLLATAVLVLGTAAVGFTIQTRPDTVSGTITRTFQIIANTEVTGRRHVRSTGRRAVSFVRGR